MTGFVPVLSKRTSCQVHSSNKGQGKERNASFLLVSTWYPVCDIAPSRLKRCAASASQCTCYRSSITVTYASSTVFPSCCHSPVSPAESNFWSAACFFCAVSLRPTVSLRGEDPAVPNNPVITGTGGWVFADSIPSYLCVCVFEGQRIMLNPRAPLVLHG